MKEEQDPNKPVAYDTEGRPLYLRPSESSAAEKKGSDPSHPDELQVVQVTRSTEPVAVTVPPEIRAKHDVSRRKYPHLNLSDGEFVILDIRRHPIGLLAIWGTALLLALVVVAGWWFLLSHPGSKEPMIDPAMVPTVSGFTLGLLLLIGLFAFVAAVVYKGNSLILTTESVIQRVQHSLLSHQEQTINLENIKDARFNQLGLIQSLVGYGTLRLTTEGDQENYTFTYVADPKEQIAIINNVIEAVKYGRPVEEAVHSVVT